MAITTRQTSLLVAEDWTKVYQTFRNADFKSYDYETLRKSMVDYLRLYYPEDFNDFIESSEFVALIDLLSFLGQSLAFRTDLNSRENFIDTAQRRDSILKLARLISYNPKRNIPASGLLKFDSVSTTETVFDSTGLNLAGLVVNWADSANDNWQEQFTAIINASLNTNQVIGKPSNTQLINGVTNAEYQVNLIPNVIGTYSFQPNIENVPITFEAISPTSSNRTYIYEADPRPNRSFNLLYKNDNLGNSSNNTGFFLYFKQGELKSVDLNFTESIPNRVYSINVDNINNSDVWLYSLDSLGNESTLWEQVPAVGVTNVIYNKGTNRTVYQINTRANDQIDLVFGDGAFATVPQGRYRLYYRVSNGQQYKITPDEMQSITVPINYVSKTGRIETLNITASLQYTVANAATRETIEDIRQKAPQQYYTQDRMVSGEDYNILPYTLFSNILKVKAINRTSSGVSRYLDVIDTTGKYSSTNVFAQDGMLYRNPTITTFSFEYNTRNDIYRVIFNQVKPIVAKQQTLQFFYAYYPLLAVSDGYWHKSTTIANGCTGFFVNSLDRPIQIGEGVSSNYGYILPRAIVKFSAGSGNYFDSKNRIQSGTPSKDGDKYYIYAAVQDLVGDGTNGGLGNLSNGSGPVTINQNVPEGAVAQEVFAVFNNEFPTDLIIEMINYIEAFQDFGLRYNMETSAWTIIYPENLSTAEFSLTNAGNTSGNGLDSSWTIIFQTVEQTYNVTSRGLEYIFESVRETNFYFDNDVKIYDPKTGLTISDQVKILKINTKPDDIEALALDYPWFIYDKITEVDGYENPNRIQVTFPDTDNDGIPDNPELFELIVAPDVNSQNKYVFFENVVGYDNFINEQPYDNNSVVTEYSSLRDIQSSATLYTDGQIFYVPDDDIFYKLTVNGAVYTLTEQTEFTAKIGRQDIYFQYRHNSPNYRRIDPSPNNIIDLYILTKQYADDYIAWIQDTSNTVSEPQIPTGDELELEFSKLEKYKSVSDTVIYNPAKFKPIFGAEADPSLQAVFKVVKNASVVVSDNDVKTSVIAAINSYFDIANWDFGETFYFSELSAYLHSVLAPNIASVIIVPSSQSSNFGSLMQINAEYNEIIVSSATVDNVQVIAAITAAQLNQISL